MLELFTYDFMQRSLLAAALVGALCSTIGVFVVLRGLAFMGAGTAHAAFAGVALGFLMGWPPLLMAILFGLATVWITGWVEEKGRMKLDASTGYQLTHSLSTLTWYSVLIGITCSVGGVLISSYWDVPSGPAIVLLATMLFFVAVLFSPKKQRRSLALG